jgi:hypothetical protein
VNKQYDDWHSCTHRTCSETDKYLCVVKFDWEFNLVINGVCFSAFYESAFVVLHLHEQFRPIHVWRSVRFISGVRAVAGGCAGGFAGGFAGLS